METAPAPCRSTRPQVGRRIVAALGGGGLRRATVGRTCGGAEGDAGCGLMGSREGMCTVDACVWGRGMRSSASPTALAILTSSMPPFIKLEDIDEYSASSADSRPAS